MKEDNGNQQRADGAKAREMGESSEAGSTDSVEFSSPACSLHEWDQGITADKTGTGMDKLKDWRKQQRSRLLKIRNQVSSTQQVALSHSVVEQLKQSGWLKHRKSIAFFWPMQGEIDLRPMLTVLVKQGVTAALPVIVEKNQPLEFWQWLPDEALSQDGPWAISAPAVRRPVNPELLLVPMLGFDDQGHRLGFGGGYYDRSIAAMQVPPLCVGVCGEFGHMQSIYPQAHDMPMHAIASESEFRIFSQPVNFD